MSQAAVLDVEGASQYLRVAASTLARWRVMGIGPRYCKAQGRVLYRLVDLEQYLSKRIVETEAEACPEAR